jgi:hypothetical protein
VTDARGVIEFDHIGIGTALSRYSLFVPLNQREYSWEERHVRELFEDFSKAISDQKSSYFLGTIVLTGGEGGKLEVADGQQRLATTMMLLAAIRDYVFLLDGAENLIVREIEQTYLYVIDLDAMVTIPRLKLNVDDHEFFCKRILARPGTEDRKIEPTKAKVSHQRIVGAAKIATDRVTDILKPYGERHQLAVLKSWVRFVRDTAKVIVLQVPDELDAFVMFETLNDRGLKTSQLDLLKNYLFGQATVSRIGEAQQKWASMMGVLETTEEDDIGITYLRHLVIANFGPTRQREVFHTIRNKVSGSGPSIAFLDSLSTGAVDYVALMNPAHPRWQNLHKIQASVKTIKSLNITVLRPLMLAVIRNFSPKEAERAFRAFVSWTVRFLIVGGNRSGYLEEAYSQAAYNVSLKRFTTAKQLADSLLNVLPNDAQFRSEFEVARVSQNYLARYYLRCLEAQKCQESYPEFVPNEDPNAINLEHVLPQNPGNNWGHIQPESAAALSRRIGNLVLLQVDKNTQIGNADFATKKGIFAASRYNLTAMVASHQDWGVKEIGERQKELAELAVHTWPLAIR